jgi:hypothetical protein
MRTTILVALTLASLAVAAPAPGGGCTEYPDGEWICGRALEARGGGCTTYPDGEIICGRDALVEPVTDVLCIQTTEKETCSPP